MLNVSKPSLWSFGRPANQPQAASAVPAGGSDAQHRLGDLMGQLDAGIAQSAAREAEKAAQSAEERGRPTAVVAEPAKLEAVPAQERTLEVVPLPTAPSVQPRLNAPDLEPLPPDDDVMTEALRIVADQRKAAEALLFEACVLEDRLNDQAKVARATREHAAAKEKVDLAAAAEQQARLFAREKSDLRAALESERRGIEELLSSKRTEVEGAKVKIDELERLVQEAKASVAHLLSVITADEDHAKQCATKEAAVQHEEAQALDRVKTCQSDREVAESEASAAWERAQSLKQTLSSQNSAGVEAVRALAARIAEQAKQVKKSAA